MPTEDCLLAPVPGGGRPDTLVPWLGLHHSAGYQSFCSAAGLLSHAEMLGVAASLGLGFPPDVETARLRLALWDHFRDPEIGMSREEAMLAVLWDASNGLAKRLDMRAGLAVGPGFDIVARVNAQVERKRAVDSTLGRDVEHAVQVHRGQGFGPSGDAPNSYCYLVDFRPSGNPDGLRAHVSVLGIMTHGVFDRPVSVVARGIGRTQKFQGPRRLRHAGEAAEAVVRAWHAENNRGDAAVEIHRDLRGAIISLASGHGRGSWTVDRDGRAETKVRINWDGPFRVVDGPVVFDLGSSRIYLREEAPPPANAIPMRRAAAGAA